MDVRYAGLIEILLTLGGVLAFGVWQLRSVARDQAATRAQNAARQVDADGDGTTSDEIPNRP